MRAEVERGMGDGFGGGVEEGDEDEDAEMEGVDMGGEEPEVGEEEEEEEVAAVVDGSFTSDSLSGGSRESHSGDEEGDGEDSAGESEDEEGKGEQKSMWRRSFEKLGWPFRSSASPEKDEEEQVRFLSATVTCNHRLEPVLQHENGNAYSSDEGEDDEQEDEADRVPATPKAQPQSQTYQRALGKFMTPQPQPNTLSRSWGAGRYSVGRGAEGARGEEEAWGGARRVKVETAWKVMDIVVPLKSEQDEENGREHKIVDEGEVKEEIAAAAMPLRKPKLSGEERKVCLLAFFEGSVSDSGWTGDPRPPAFSSDHSRHVLWRASTWYRGTSDIFAHVAG